jgi:hypothetical protein
MTKITQVTVQGQPIDLLAYKNEIGYSMRIGERNYGIRIKLESRKVIDIATAVALLIANSLDTRETLKNENTN